ncbi:hypothetical protein KBD81_01190 [Candidatus Woesebacteria bacterium]|nr:hypothetical protein [Candidatus Woesebacteria bacterium]
MKYKGIIIAESLKDQSILDSFQIIKTKIETVTERHQTPWITQWTLHTVEIAEDEIEQVVEDISHSLETEHSSWYTDFKNDQYHYIVFSEKIFKVDLKNPVLYHEVKAYGMSKGIPGYQLGFV